MLRPARFPNPTYFQVREPDYAQTCVKLVKIVKLMKVINIVMQMGPQCSNEDIPDLPIKISQKGKVLVLGH